jgi:methionine synthase II (cobalamin-independent)
MAPRTAPPFRADLATAYADEITALAALGCTCLQFDDTLFALVFSGLQADGYFLEYDDERSGTFEPLRFVPADKVVVLGVVTTKTPVLESKEDLKRRSKPPPATSMPTACACPPVRLRLRRRRQRPHPQPSQSQTPPPRPRPPPAPTTKLPR